ncbi:MAG: hypothetical protein Q8K65_00150 [Alphaproteobacteria bacterium]|nr:hypothetical protein [Alphaproteobacteria bacterium]
MFQKDFFKLTALYTLGIIIIFYICWVFLQMALPEAELDLVQTLSTAFGINLPDSMELKTDTEERMFYVVLIIAGLSIALIVLNVFFSAIITARFIRPKVKFLTSSRGVLSTTWNPTTPYMLVRMSNFYGADLVDVNINVVMTVEEVRQSGAGTEQFMCYLPVQDFTPQRILVMEQRTPWSLAVPADILLGNSLTKNYHFKPGKPIVASFSAGKKIISVKRTLQILVQGTDARSYSHFVIHRRIPIDEQDGNKYVLHLHKGSFKSLPLRIEDESDLEKVVD